MRSACFRVTFYDGVVALGIVMFELEDCCGVFGFEFILKWNILFVCTFPDGVDVIDTVDEISYFDFTIFDAIALGKVSLNSSVINFRYFILFHQFSKFVT